MANWCSTDVILRPLAMNTGSTKTLPPDFDVLAPDGSEVRILLSLPRASMAHFRLPPGQISLAVRHRTVEEIWYILSGQGEMWRSVAGQEEIVPLSSGTCLTIRPACRFSFAPPQTLPYPQ